jgi:5-methylcytosine-specific restriction endonuclease McrA
MARLLREGAKAAVLAKLGVQPNGQPHPVECEYCGHVGAFRVLPRPGRATLVQSFDLEFDHIIPYGRGCATHESNTAISCVPCNISKGERLVGEWVDWLAGPRGATSKVNRTAILDRLDG